MSLAALKMGVDVATVSTNPRNIGDTLQEKYPKVFKSVGKLKDRAVQLHIDPDIKPVAQTMLSTPFSLRSKVDEKVK